MLNKLNLPNKLSILRILLVPIFVVFMALPIELSWSKWVALGIYIVASITDCLDGYIARKNNLVTKFGKVIDPLADKLLVSAGVIMLVGFGVIPAWIAVIIVFRDFCATSLRVLASENKADLGAHFSGKIKTVFQLIGICLGILSVALYATNNEFLAFISAAVNMTMIQLLINVFMSVSIIVATACTLWSLVDYFLVFKKDISTQD